jgi:hypothetical protein
MSDIVLEFAKQQKDPVTKRDLSVIVNAFRLDLNKEIYLYSVVYDPPLDLQTERRQRKSTLNIHLKRDVPVFVFDNTLLYVVGKKLEKLVYPETKYSKYKLVLEFLKMIRPQDKEYQQLQWVSVMIGRMLIKNQKYFQIRRKLINPVERVDISPRLELYRGTQFIPARGTAGGFYLFANKIRQFFRKDTSLDFIRQYPDAAKDELVGSSVVTKYGERPTLYKVQKILESERPNKFTFKYKDKEVTVCVYFLNF